MKVNFNQDKITFNAKVSPRFVNSMRGFVNNGSNRLRNNYLLTEKLAQYEKFGFDDYTVEMSQRSGPLGLEYILSAIREGDPEEKRIILGIRDSYWKIYKRFMNYNKHDFCEKMRAKLNKINNQ